MKCQFYFLFYVVDILVVCRCIQINVLIFTYMSKYFFKSLWQRETQINFFWEIIAYEPISFINKPRSFLAYGFSISFKNYFLEEWEQIHQFSLKSKTTEGNSAAISFPWRVVSMLFFTWHESDLNFLSSST